MEGAAAPAPSTPSSDSLVEGKALRPELICNKKGKKVQVLIVGSLVKTMVRMSAMSMKRNWKSPRLLRICKVWRRLWSSSREREREEKRRGRQRERERQPSSQSW